MRENVNRAIEIHDSTLAGISSDNDNLVLHLDQAYIHESIGINCQERTHDELIETLKITLKEGLEFNRQEALKAAKSNYTEEPLLYFTLTIIYLY